MNLLAARVLLWATMLPFAFLTVFAVPFAVLIIGLLFVPGLVTVWFLAFHYTLSTRAPKLKALTIVGLVCGAASLALLIAMPVLGIEPLTDAWHLPALGTPAFLMVLGFFVHSLVRTSANPMYPEDRVARRKLYGLEE